MLAHRSRHEFGLEDAFGGGEMDLGGHGLSGWTWGTEEGAKHGEMVLGSWWVGGLLVVGLVWVAELVGIRGLGQLLVLLVPISISIQLRLVFVLCPSRRDESGSSERGN